ncbi:uncharacterized protein G2W53_041105 [Senna tora]|uniref:Uncharacterized protein n=1 Tax=Senna tora TaxID=362788 RepID=A0A834W2L3_9FABA|nr:uncharacterized protein G2W53_041105 [Senna tora]
MGFLAMATCHSKSHKIYNSYEIKEEMTGVLRNCPTCKPNSRLKGISKYFKENFDPP